MISAKSLRIDYEDLTAVWDLDLEVQPGEIFGLVGPNGAGKTSTIKALAGLLEPTYGDIRIGGLDMALEPEKCWKQLGYMPDFPPAYKNLKVGEYLEVFAAAHLIPRGRRVERAMNWVERLHIEAKWDTFVRDLSRGIRQRLVLAKTLLPEPKCLLLDEPASGMDPIARVDLRNILKEVAARGVAVLVSSHILTELSDICTAIGVMEKGRMIVQGSVEEIRERIGAKARLRLRLSGDRQAIPEELQRIIGRSNVTGELRAVAAGEFEAAFAGTDQDAAALIAEIVAAGLPLADFHVEKENIEDIFMRIGAREVS